MVLAGASEFDPQYNKDSTSRPTDNILIPQVRLILQIPQ
jgi:translocation protein SEC63